MPLPTDALRPPVAYRTSHRIVIAIGILSLLSGTQLLVACTRHLLY
ncbi:hypothetical protein [Sphingomonas sp. CARO-RG-8B-R24-01]|nr:hypothetical protein [Sphingomonas sp. CARO-RG-8B-R24-01]